MILVTGANGYVGSYVLKELKACNVLEAEAVIGAVQGDNQQERIRAIGAQPLLLDVTDIKSLDSALIGVDTVIHLAAVNRDKGATTMERINAQGTINVVDAAKRAGVRHIIALVGLGADSKRPYPLANTQGRGIEYLMASGVAYTILEASVIFGAGDEFLNTLAGLARVPPVMVVPGDGKSKFQPVAVQDVAACIVKSVNNPVVINQRLQICGSEILTLEEIIDAIIAEMNLRRVKLHMPVPILKIAVNMMDKLLPKPPVTPSLLAQLGVDNVATQNAVRATFGIEPMKLREGISFVREMTLGKLIRRTMGQIEYR